MRRADAECSQYRRPDGVAFAFQIAANSIEPTVPNRACNLLPNDCARAALADEPEQDRPEMPVVGLAPLFAGRAEGLAGATGRPDRLLDGPTGKGKGETPPTNPGKEMALRISAQLAGLHVANRSGVDIPPGDEAFRNKLAEPSGGFGVVLIVIIHKAGEKELPTGRLTRPLNPGVRAGGKPAVGAPGANLRWAK